MKEPSEDLLIAYGRVAWGYNQIRTAQVLEKSDDPEYIKISKQLKEDRIELEKLQRQYNDKHYTMIRKPK